MSPSTATRRRTTSAPNALVVRVPGLDRGSAHRLAVVAVERARSIAPKSSGRGAAGLAPYFGAGFFGITWDEPYMWFQEQGIKPFTMRNLAGKLIPMWVTDHDGSEARKIPLKDRARRTRVDASGKRQVLIFRKAAKIGARKTVRGPNGAPRSVPASYPGAPGRISARHTVDGTSTGKIAARHNGRAHVGVRWRHPGILARGFMHHALISTAASAGINTTAVHQTHRK